MTRMSEIKTVEEFERYQAERRTRWTSGGNANLSFEVPIVQPTQRIDPLPSKSKYGNVRTDGYDSRKEARRGADLKLMEQAGAIRNLRTHVRYIIVPEQRDTDGTVLERKAEYEADFVYEEGSGGIGGPTEWHQVVEDAKGCRTPMYVLKRKLLLMLHGIRIRET